MYCFLQIGKYIMMLWTRVFAYLSKNYNTVLEVSNVYRYMCQLKGWGEDKRTDIIARFLYFILNGTILTPSGPWKLRTCQNRYKKTRPNYIVPANSCNLYIRHKLKVNWQKKIYQANRKHKGWSGYSNIKTKITKDRDILLNDKRVN